MAEKFNYLEMRDLAVEMIEEFGQEAVYVKKTSSGNKYGGKPGEEDHPCRLVPLTYEQKYIDGTSIRISDRLLIVDPTSIPSRPNLNDTFVINGTRYSIVDLDPNNYDGQTDVVYMIQGRVAVL